MRRVLAWDRSRLSLMLSALLAVFACCASAPAMAAPRDPVILVSIDGFRPDYLDRGLTPTLSRLAEEGVRGALRPAFPSKTFPNHYAIVTGLRPDRNGIVENTMEDPAIPGVTFRMSNRQAVRDRRWWDDAEPIWVTAERAGIITAPVFWPGSEAAIRGVRPHYYLPFAADTSGAWRVDLVLALLDQPAARRPRFLTLYFDAVDTVGHDFGPNSPELDASLREVDKQMLSLIQGLEARGVKANLVIVADHGMAEMSDARVLYMDDILPRDAYRSLSGGAFMTLYPALGREAEVDRALIRPHANLQCWRKAEIPARLRYGRHPRVAPYFCLPDTGWRITTRDWRPAKPERGAHGFDPASPDMAAIFVAHGPAFRQGVRLETQELVDVYPLLATLLGVRARESDGDPSALRPSLER